MASKLKDLIGRLRRPDATSAELFASLAEAREALATAEVETARTGRAYDAGLLDLDDARLQVIRAQREAAELARDRARALVASLETRAAETKAAEAAAAFEAERAAIDAEAEALGALIRKRYPQLAKELCGLMHRITEVDDRVAAMNKRLQSAGRPDVLADVQARGLPQPTSSHARAPSIWGRTVLTGIEGFAPGWNDALFFETGGNCIVAPPRESGEWGQHAKFFG